MIRAKRGTRLRGRTGCQTCCSHTPLHTTRQEWYSLSLSFSLSAWLQAAPEVSNHEPPESFEEMPELIEDGATKSWDVGLKPSPSSNVLQDNI